MTTVERVIAFSTGSFWVPRGLMLGGEPFLGGAVPVRYPFLCFAVALSGGGWVLVDAGLDAGHAPTGIIRERLFSLIAGSEAPPEARFSARLRSLGIERADVRAAVLTHLDFDHTGGLPEIAGVPVYVDPDEWREARAPALRERLTGRQDLAPFAATLARREPAYARRDGVPLAGGAFDVPEAGGALAVVPLPGHTPGHCGVLVTLEEGGPGRPPRRLLLCGDACIHAEHVTDRAPPGALMRGFAMDAPRLLTTLDALRRWRAEEPSLRVVPSHDPTVGARCENRAGCAVLYAREREPAAAGRGS
jgi:glyoxylase-like metal-dependent hydrolase (beta-lactamase superfamily II)